ncbi:MAG: hypothetical protein JW751_07265 [Polyangiaceae bacterium]|nr:hypothetical protein [Polyangiaceae bacterium]
MTNENRRALAPHRVVFPDESLRPVRDDSQDDRQLERGADRLADLQQEILLELPPRRARLGDRQCSGYWGIHVPPV